MAPLQQLLWALWAELSFWEHCSTSTVSWGICWESVMFVVSFWLLLARRWVMLLIPSSSLQDLLGGFSIFSSSPCSFLTSQQLCIAYDLTGYCRLYLWYILVLYSFSCPKNLFCPTPEFAAVSGTDTSKLLVSLGPQPSSVRKPHSTLLSPQACAPISCIIHLESEILWSIQGNNCCAFLFQNY